jgi:hypothetical protein
VASLSLLVGEAMETIKFYGKTITRRVINVSRLFGEECGHIVYQTNFYQVTRPAGTDIWETVEGGEQASEGTSAHPTMLTRAELYYLKALVEMDAHDNHKDSGARMTMILLRKIERMHDEATEVEEDLIFGHLDGTKKECE